MTGAAQQRTAPIQFSVIVSLIGWGLMTLGIIAIPLSVFAVPLLALIYLPFDWFIAVYLLAPLAIMGLGMTMIHIGRTLRRPILRPGYCRGCDYDLRGLASERCPECGLEK